MACDGVFKICYLMSGSFGQGNMLGVSAAPTDTGAQPQLSVQGVDLTPTFLSCALTRARAEDRGHSAGAGEQTG